MAGTIQTGNFPRSLELGINKFYGMGYNLHPKQYIEFMEVQKSVGRAYEIDHQLENFRAAETINQGDSVPIDSMTQGFLPKYVHKKVGLGFICTEELLADNQYGLFLKGAKMVGLSLSQALEINAANVLNRAFNSIYTMEGGDGIELCATNHRRGASDSTTYSNELATPASLSEVSYEEATILVRKFQDARGNRINIMPTKLIVPPDLGPEACRITKSDYRTNSANNDINATKQMYNNGYAEINYLTSTTAWFLKTDCQEGLKHFSRLEPTFQKDMDFPTSNTRFKGTYRASDGWTDNRTIIGSQGTS